MTECQVNVLVIAPYEGLVDPIRQAGEAFPMLNMDVRVADLQAGLALIRQTNLSLYDVVVSRGGTADLLRSQVKMPVVDIRITVYDVLKALRLVASHYDRYAVIGFSNITETAHTLCHLLQNDVRIETIAKAQDVSLAIDRLVLDDYRAVICDAVSYHEAKRRGMNAFMITSGQDSLHDTLQRALNQGKTWHELRHTQLLMNGVLQKESIQMAALQRNGTVAMYWPEEPSPSLLACLRQHIPEVSRGTGTFRFFFNDQRMLYSVRAWQTALDGKMVSVFSWRQSQIPLRTDRFGIRSLSATECEHLFNTSFYSTAGAMGSLSERVTALAQVRQAVMIYGEPGTGKEAIARALYLRGTLTRSPYITIDCSVLNEKNWAYVLNHHASPLNDNNVTVFFQHMESIGEKARNELLSAIQDTDLLRRVRVLFGCDCPMKSPLPAPIQQLAQRLGCAMLYLPPLRTRLDELPSLSQQYLQYLVTEEGKGLAGLDPNALQLMREYDWPGNYSQLKRVLNELAAITPFGYIHSNDMAQIITRERTRGLQPTKTTVPEASVPTGTLQDMTLMMVRQTLAQCGDNQTLAARKLGISRTTLWRYISRLGAMEDKNGGHQE